MTDTYVCPDGDWWRDEPPPEATCPSCGLVPARRRRITCKWCVDLERRQGFPPTATQIAERSRVLWRGSFKTYEPFDDGRIVLMAPQMLQEMF